MAERMVSTSPRPTAARVCGFVLLCLAFASALPISYTDLLTSINASRPIVLSPGAPLLWTYFSFSLARVSSVTIQVESTALACLIPGGAVFAAHPMDTAQVLPGDALVSGVGAGAVRSLTLHFVGTASGPYTLALYGQSSTSSCTMGTVFVRSVIVTAIDLPLDCGAMARHLDHDKCDAFLAQFVGALSRRVPIGAPMALTSASLFAIRQGAIADPAQWTYATVTLRRGQLLTLRLRRTTSCVDPAMSLFFGVPADTTGLTAFTSSRADAAFVAFSDDELPAAPYGDPQLSHVAAQDGVYTVAV